MLKSVFFIYFRLETKGKGCLIKHPQHQNKKKEKGLIICKINSFSTRELRIYKIAIYTLGAKGWKEKRDFVYFLNLQDSTSLVEEEKMPLSPTAWLECRHSSSWITRTFVRKQPRLPPRRLAVYCQHPEFFRSFPQ